MTTHAMTWTDPLPPELTGGAVTVGNFDGVHRGHQELIRTARQAANRIGGPVVAVTFYPPPAAVLYPKPEKAIPLTTLEDRARLLVEAGADHVVVLNTDAGLLSLSPEAFFEDVILHLFNARAMVEGYNFRFGRGRCGDTQLIRTLCDRVGLSFAEVPAWNIAGAPVSSSRIRDTLNAGAVAEATRLLGRPYRITGKVVTGAQRGRTLGFPTANIDGVPTLVPAVGVYAVRVCVRGEYHLGAANIGPNPTFGETARKIEVHLLDFAGDLYEQPLSLDFVARLRDTRPFAGVDELVHQLQQDVLAARAVLSE
ncbi:MAG: bifunctional riboflavin kinase/FAD synthetase [Bacteroidales bacterium]|nr:bifunctional riboflavin kinase/FAD synthetase [Bacteroidales bacterium]